MEFNAKEYWNNRADSWIKSASPDAKTLTMIKAFLKKVPSTAKKITDMGCGTCVYLDAFRGYEYTGIDVCAKFIEYNKKAAGFGTFKCVSIQDHLKSTDCDSEIGISLWGMMNIPTEEFDEVANLMNKKFKYIILLDSREDTNKFGEQPQSQYHNFSKKFNIIYEENITDLNRLMLIQPRKEELKNEKEPKRKETTKIRTNYSSKRH